MGPSCQGKSFPAPVENLVPQILPSVSLTLIDSICFFFDILLLGDITLAATFIIFIGRLALRPTIWSLVSGR